MKRVNLRALAALAALLSGAACSSSSTTTTAPAPTSIAIAGAPSKVFLNDTAQLTVSANVANAPAVTWSVITPGGGTISSSGLYTAPGTAGTYSISATSTATNGLAAFTTLNVGAPVPGDLTKGGFVIAFRHFQATVGADQTSSTVPNWWKSCDSSLARQLDATGIAQGTAAGNKFRSTGIPVSAIISSEYCRTLTSAQLMNLGAPITTSQALTFFVYPNPIDSVTTLLNTPPAAGSNTILFSHITQYPSTFPLNMGDAEIVRPIPGATARPLGVIPVTTWAGP